VVEKFSKKIKDFPFREETEEGKPELFIGWKLLNEEFPYARNKVPRVFSEST
jgi:hypothetical protein